MDRGLLEDTKSILKSLIISCPHGMTIDNLNKDYRNMEGRWIPYSALGFTKLETFLKSLTDTLIVSGSGYDAKVQAISSEKTAHIDSMVAKQKSASRSRRHPMPRRPASVPVNNYRPPLIQSVPPLIQSVPPPPVINSTSINHSNHQHNRQLHQQQHQHMQQQYYNRIPVPTHNDYINLLTYPLHEFQRQLNTYRNIQFHVQRNTQFLQYQPQYQNMPHNIPLLNHLHHQNMSNNIPILNRVQQRTHNNIVEKQPQQVHLPSNYKTENKQNNSLSNTNVVNGYKSTSPKLNNNNLANGELSSLEEKEIQELNNSIRSFEENNSAENTEKLKEIMNSSVSSKHSNVSKKSQQEIQENNRETVISNSIAAYDNLLNISDENLNEDLDEITDRFKAMTLQSKSETKANSFSNLEAIPELHQNDIIFQLDYPVDTVKYGEYIPESEIPENIADASWFGIFITEIHNPYKFWFHLYKEHHELDTLMQEIENIYKNLGTNELQLHNSSAKPGQICCAQFMKMWHRAEILEAPDHGKVKVCFVDYGTVSLIDIKHIKYLLVDFSSLRSQALRGTLAHIKPITHRWSRDASYAFLDMVSDLLLYAKATDINYKDRVIQMILTDTNKEIDFQINDALVRKGHARLCSTVPTTQSTSSDSQITTTPRKHFQELYPTFEMLEKGEYPSFTELGILLSKGINFEALQDQNIIPDVDGGHSIEEITKILTTPNISRTEIFDFIDDSNDNEKYDEKNIDEEKEDVILESLHENNNNLSILSNPEKSNPFLTPSLSPEPQFNSYNNSTKIISPILERNAQENHLTKRNLNDNDFSTKNKFNSLNPFITESIYDQVDSNESQKPSQPFYVESQNQIYYQAPTQPLPLFPISNEDFNQFNNFNNITNGNLSYDQFNNITKPKRPPPGFENVVPRSRNILFQ